MKKIYFIAVLIISIIIPAQIGINNSNPDPSATLDITSSNKGINIPHIYLQSYTDVSTVPNPKESLIIYNTNATLGGKESYYFWNGSKWDYLFNDLNMVNLTNNVKYYSGLSSSGYTFTTSPNQFYGNAPHVIGENITAQPTWTVITDLTKNIIIDRATNEVIFNINGMINVNNTGSSNAVATTFGFFVDDKLADIKPVLVDLKSACTFRQFVIYGVANNLAVGNHTVKFAIRNISAPGTSGLTVTYGAKNSACSNISNDEASMSGTIFLNQPYVF